MAIPRRLRADVMNNTMAIYANDSQLTVMSLKYMFSFHTIAVFNKSYLHGSMLIRFNKPLPGVVCR